MVKTCQLLPHSQDPGSEISDATAHLVQAKYTDDSTGRPETVSIPNIFSQPTPTAGIMKSILQRKIVRLPVPIADCTFLHHNQTMEKKEHHVVLGSSSLFSISLVCCRQSEIMFAFWKIFICLNKKKKKKAQTLHI